MFSSSALGCLALKVRHGWHWSMCSLTCAAMQGQKKWLHIKSSICSRHEWPTLSWHSWGSLPMHSQQDQLGIGPHGIPLVGSSYTECPTSIWGGCIHKQAVKEFRWISQFKLILAQCPIQQSHNHNTQDQICLLSLVPVIYGHASDLQTVPYRVQDA